MNHAGFVAGDGLEDWVDVVRVFGVYEFYFRLGSLFLDDFPKFFGNLGLVKTLRRSWRLYEAESETESNGKKALTVETACPVEIKVVAEAGKSKMVVESFLERDGGAVGSREMGETAAKICLSGGKNGFQALDFLLS